MTKNFAKYTLMGLMLTAAMTACNKDEDTLETEDWGYTSENTESSTAITTFALKANSKVLAHLDSVFFTIDLNGARIFNADSLPYGTKVSKLLLNIGTKGSAKITIKCIDADSLKLKEVEYSSSDNKDSVNFDQPVTVTVESLNKLYTRTYNIQVNVHKMKPDSLTWGNMAYCALPSDATPVAQKTVERDGTAYCLTFDGSAYTLATTSDPEDTGSWEKTPATFSFTPDMATLTAAKDAFYILSTDGELYSSADAKSWTSTGVTSWVNIYGAYDGYILGVEKSGESHFHVAYPASANSIRTEVDAACPVTGTSQMYIFTNKWSANPQGIIVGGRTSSGDPTGDTWGFDGTGWTRFSSLPEKLALEGVTLFPYFTFKVSTLNWTTTTYSTLFAMGGRDAQGKINSNIYISRDLGLNWHAADELMKLPEEVTPVSFAQALIYNTTYTGSRSANGKWHKIAIRPLPAWWTVADSDMLASMIATSRATTEITSWECPYIYLFGGYTADGTLSNTVWRGVINRLMFKPLQ